MGKLTMTKKNTKTSSDKMVKVAQKVLKVSKANFDTLESAVLEFEKLRLAAHQLAASVLSQSEPGKDKK